MKELKPAILIFFFLTVVCGVIYPAAVTLVAGIVFPRQAAGSLITDGSGRVIGSALVGQPFSDPKYFWPRPSATGPLRVQPGRVGWLEPRAHEPRLRRRTGGPRGSPARSRDHRTRPLRSRAGLGKRASTRTSRRRVLAPRWRGSPGHGASTRRILIGSSPPASRRLSSAYWEARVNVLELNMALEQQDRQKSDATGGPGNELQIPQARQ